MKEQVRPRAPLPSDTAKVRAEGVSQGGSEGGSEGGSDDASDDDSRRQSLTTAPMRAESHQGTPMCTRGRAGMVAAFMVGLVSGWLLPAPAQAQGWGAEVEVHGFVSQGAVLSTGNDYLVRSQRGSVEFFEAGLNLSTEVADRLRVGIQLFARDLGSLGDYSAKVDWAYLDYRWRRWLGLRAGRIKLPFGLYNEFSDIDSARLPILLPQSVYP